MNRLTGNVDLRKGENHFFYHRVTTDNRWVPIPWDLDMMYIAKTHQGTTINGKLYPGVFDQYRSILQNPNLALEYRNRAREILDLVASDGTRDGGQIGQLFDEFSQIVSPDGTTDNLANADAAMWNLHPRAQGTVNNSTGLGDASGQTNHRGNFFRAVYSDVRNGGNWIRQLRAPGFVGVPNHQDLVNYFVGYATNTFPSSQTWAVNNGNQYGYGYQYLLSETSDAAIPQKPTLTYNGPAKFPVDRLAFSSSAYNGTNPYANSQWRVAEISAPGIPGYVANRRKYEITSSWSTATSGNSMVIPPSAVRIGGTYRARVRHLDASGRWSHWSAPVQFVVGNEAARVAHYWNFNSATLSQALLPVVGIDSSITTIAGGTAAFSSDTGQNFAAANARFGDVAAQHLRVNNPIGASLIIKMPTTGFEKVTATVETRRSGSGAGIQSWSYTLDGTNYMSLGDIAVVDGDPATVAWDFKAITAADQNPRFALKVTFSAGGGGTVGNNRFDNLVMTGTPLPGSYAYWVNQNFNETDQLQPVTSGINADADGDGRTNFQEFALNTAPNLKDTSGVAFVWSQDGVTRRPALQFDRPSTRIGVTYELQASTTLASGDWQIVASLPYESQISGVKEQVIFRDATASDAMPKRFYRMKITPTSTIPP